MAKHTKLASLYGKTLQWTFRDGPMAGATYQHTFHKNGSVDFSAVEGSAAGEPTREKHAAAVKVTDDVFIVSYLGAAGYTLTVALNFQDMTMVGFASNEQEWSQQSGTFELLEAAEA
jgi:phenolic acid decarboxylase